MLERDGCVLLDLREDEAAMLRESGEDDLSMVLASRSSALRISRYAIRPPNVRISR